MNLSVINLKYMPGHITNCKPYQNIKNSNRLIVKSIFTVIFIYSSFSSLSFSQPDSLSLKETAISRLVEQIVLFPQEKIHLHIDKPCYLAGERIWFRAYLADGILNQPVTNQYVYVDLINPFDSLISRVKIRQNDSAYYGFIDLKETLPEGDYTLCAYSDNMLNTGETSFFKKNILITAPLSAEMLTDVKFSFESGDRITAEITFTDNKTKKKRSPGRVIVMLNNNTPAELIMRNDTVGYYSFRLPENSRHRVLSIITGKGSKYVIIPYLHNDYDVTFYPEGGNVTCGTECRVAFKALQSNGLPEEITGTIVDSRGREYGKIETVHDGMGAFSILSKDDVILYAVCKNKQGNEKRFELPSAMKGICSLKTETVNDTLYLSVLRTPDFPRNDSLLVLIHTRGIVMYAFLWDNEYTTASFNTKKFPSGVTQILLFDSQLRTLSERLVFMRNNDQAQVVINTDRKYYSSREKVCSTVNITDERDLPLEGSFSVSVINEKDLNPDTTVTIMTTLLLTSELRGWINNPSYYFSDNAGSDYALDLLMMTNGWRRYNIPDVISGQYETPKLPLKNGMEISGVARTVITGKPVKNGKVSILSKETGYYEETVTDTSGYFVFNGIEYQDSTSFVIQVLNNRKNNRAELSLNHDLLPGVAWLPILESVSGEKKEEEQKLSAYVEKADTKYVMENGMRTIYLDEIIIKRTAPEKKEYRPSYYLPSGISNVNLITEEEVPFAEYQNTSEILLHLPFISIVEVDGIKKVTIDRARHRLDRTDPVLYAAIIIDDVVMNDFDIDLIAPDNIERIGVLKGAQATILAGGGAGGAIVFTTKSGYFTPKEVPVFNVKSCLPLGYQKPAEFYSPRYDTPEQMENRQPDLRTTIYWNPVVTVDSQGEAAFDFYTSDDISSYSVVIEGITREGAIIRKTAEIHGEQKIIPDME